MSCNEQSILNNVFGNSGWKMFSHRSICMDDIYILPVQHVVSFQHDGTHAFLFVLPNRWWVWYPKMITPLVVYQNIDNTKDDQSCESITIFKIVLKDSCIYITDTIVIGGRITITVCLTERVELVRKWLNEVGTKYTDTIQVPKWSSKYPDMMYHANDNTSWTIWSVALYHPAHTRTLWAQYNIFGSCAGSVMGLEFKQLLTPYRQYKGLTWNDTGKSLIRLYIDDQYGLYCLKYGRRTKVGELNKSSQVSSYKNTIQYMYYRVDTWIVSHKCHDDVMQPDSVGVIESAKQSIHIKCFGNI